MGCQKSILEVVGHCRHFRLSETMFRIIVASFCSFFHRRGTPIHLHDGWCLWNLGDITVGLLFLLSVSVART